MTNDILCYSCEKPKHNLHMKKSGLLPGVNLLMCQSCIDLKYEPRWVIILSARKYGADHVREYIVKHRYAGRDILGTEIIV